ncbi:MAG: hypothetical protein UT90_C0004G0055 [Parcubacteria group bacterium GW2011_GWA1_40_21]|nr:MAG: hypothetical protein UT90_C0004G0055 [Parcubacteria group bacterium GW2011_GWA1_40_21]
MPRRRKEVDKKLRQNIKISRRAPTIAYSDKLSGHYRPHFIIRVPSLREEFPLSVIATI